MSTQIHRHHVVKRARQVKYRHSADLTQHYTYPTQHYTYPPYVIGDFDTLASCSVHDGFFGETITQVVDTAVALSGQPAVVVEVLVLL